MIILLQLVHYYLEVSAESLPNRKLLFGKTDDYLIQKWNSPLVAMIIHKSNGGLHRVIEML